MGRQQLAERAQLREVAEQRPAVARPERELAAVVLEHAAKAVPLRLVAPARRAGSSETSSASIGGNGTFGPGASGTPSLSQYADARRHARCSRRAQALARSGGRSRLASGRVERGRASRRAPHRRPRPAGEGHLHVPQRTVPDQVGLRRRRRSCARTAPGARSRSRGRRSSSSTSRRRRAAISAAAPSSSSTAGRSACEPAARGPVQEVVRTGDFEAVLSWAIGLDKRRPFHVARAGANVVVIGRLTGELPQPGLGTRV